MRLSLLVSSAFLLCLSALGCTAGNGAGGAPDAQEFDVLFRDTGPGLPDTGPRADAGPPGECELELCDNGLDDDCDGTVEEGCGCVPGEVRSCFRGPVAARLHGACVDGTMTCTDGVEFGTWGPCTGDVVPADEVCDAARADENCDGATNEGCDCDPATGPVACGSDEGACIAGMQACVDGRLGECVGATGPGAESCNALDDDCDGTTDEGIRRACGSDVGECTSGTETCVAGAFDGCSGSVGPAVEDCDGLDNDCDGMIDESLSRACGSAMGACRAGTQACSAGAWGTCSGETLPMVESCNAMDDDCDGRTDESLSRACGSSVGTCRPGTETCAAGTYGACTGGMGPGTEVCDGRNDENCNGTVDEGCGCTSGMMRACGTDVGACSAGSQTCDATGMWGPCGGAVGPMAEVCNRLDDDCDGMSDEGGVCPTSPPTAVCPPAVTANVLTTVSLPGSGSDPDGGTVTYAWSVTTRPVGSSSAPTPATSASPTFFLDASGSYLLRFCVTDDEMQTTCCEVPVTSRAPGALHVEVQWSTAFGDVDAHLLNVSRTSPTGWFTTDDCYFENRTPDWGTAGAVANPTLDRDDTDGYGPENVTIATSPAAGTYTVGAHYFCSHSVGTGSVAPGDGPTMATVRIYCDGALIATYPGISLTRTDDWRDVATVDYPSCVGRSVSRMTNGSTLLPAAFTAPRHCEIPCTSDASCPAGERCRAVVGMGGRRNICLLD